MSKDFHPLVSVIVPVYNAENYLNQAVTSLLNQTYHNLEIILVDDRSTDSSLAMCKNFALRDSRVRVLQTAKNSGGPLRGRVIGLRRAKGEWITSMDCDDFVDSTYVEHLLKTTKNGQYDIAVTGHTKVWDDGRREPFKWQNFHQTTSERLAEFYLNYIRSTPDNIQFWFNPADTFGQNLINSSVVKRALANGDFDDLPNNVWAEDTLMAAILIANSRKGVNFIDYHDFNWRQREGSGSHGGFSMRADQKCFYKKMDEIFATNYDKFKLSKQMPLVSVIIPIYNVERYLNECVDSVLNQTYRNLEIILVDDKSPGLSGKMADNYAKKDNRVRVIHKPQNEGVFSTRIAGMKVMSGDYFTSIDSDDYMGHEYIANLVSHLITTSADIVTIKNFTLQYPNKSRELLIPNAFSEAKNYDEYLSALGNHEWGWEVCGKLFKKRLWTEAKKYFVKYDQRLHMGDDIVMYSILRYFSTRQTITNTFDYFYRQTGESVTTTTDHDKLLSNLGDIVKAMQTLVDFVKSIELYNNTNQQNLKKFAQSQMLSAVNKITEHDDEVRLLKQKIEELNIAIHAKDAEIASYLSIKRSAKLTVENMRRRIKYGKQR
ncbi:MAG: glycosyltransferase family 2 protein [Candidatus Nanoperiomorbaceae bacterium]